MSADNIDIYWFDTPVSFPDNTTTELGRLVDFVVTRNTSVEIDMLMTFPDGATIGLIELADFILDWNVQAEIGLVDMTGGAEFGAALYVKVRS